MTKEWNDEKHFPPIMIRQWASKQGEEDDWKALQNSTLGLIMTNIQDGKCDNDKETFTPTTNF